MKKEEEKKKPEREREIDKGFEFREILDQNPHFSKPSNSSKPVPDHSQTPESKKMTTIKSHHQSCIAELCSPSSNPPTPLSQYSSRTPGEGVIHLLSAHLQRF